MEVSKEQYTALVDTGILDVDQLNEFDISETVRYDFKLSQSSYDTTVFEHLKDKIKDSVDVGTVDFTIIESDTKVGWVYTVPIWFENRKEAVAFCQELGMIDG